LRPADPGNSVKPDALEELPAPKPVTAPPAGPKPEPDKPVTPVAPPPAPVLPALPAVPELAPPGPPKPVPATPVDRPKVGSPDPFVFPAPARTGGTASTPDPQVTTPGDNTMTSSLRQTAVAAVIGGALAFTPAKAPGLPFTTSTAAELQKKTVEEQLDEINKKLNRLTELLDGRRDEKGFPLPSDPGLVAELRTLKDKVADLEKQINQLKASTSLRPGTTTDLMAGKGTVRVVNEYPVEVSIVVNQNSYRVAPNTKLDVTVPAGEFTYQLLQSGAAVTRSAIKEKETVTLRIR
jgi:hypothetical protein